ncbi:hypothetical protein [Paenibacillus taichungensis]|uniref:hypothetical protein n=1 Tax=Paenibacillus taichungensis TaxID=484184 RepID=UPI0039A6D1E5
MKIQQRMAFHFAYQLIFCSLLILTITLVACILYFQNAKNNEIRRNFPAGALQLIDQEANSKDGTIQISPKWVKLIEEKGMWLQVANAEGKVIYDVNLTPHHALPATWTLRFYH